MTKHNELNARQNVMPSPPPGPGAAKTPAARRTDLAPGEIWSAEYWAKKGGLSLYIWRKRLGAPAPGEPRRRVLFMVHGSSNSARTSYDLAVPGKGEYSMMNMFARYGYEVWTMDHEGYGRSALGSGNSDIASGVADLKVATELVARETGREKFHFFGTSSGGIRASAFAVARPDRVDRLVLSAYTYKGTNAPTLTERAKNVDYFRTHNTRLRDRAMIHSIFTRDGLASSYDQAVAEVMADEELKFGDQVPTGTYLDMVANLPVVDPAKVTCPVLMIRGDHDGISTLDDLLDFYRQLPNGDRQFVILPDVAHSPVFAHNRHLLWHATRQFLDVAEPDGM
jgi:alpha-beta hydrolase superfamily lysophospholipase